MSPANYDASKSPPEVRFPPKLAAAFRGLPGSVSVQEGGSNEFNVRLTTSPGDSDVTVTIAQPASDTGVTIDTDRTRGGNQNTLTFTDDNWGDTQTVYVSAARDDNHVSERATLNLSATGGASGDYSYASVRGSVTVNVEDTTTGGLTISFVNVDFGSGTRSVTLPQGGSYAFAVRLTTQPTRPVTLTFSEPASSSGVTVDTDNSQAGRQSTVVIDPRDWDKRRVVTVSATDDAPTGRNAVTLDITASGPPEYSSVEAELRVDVVASRLRALPDPAGLTLTEGEKGTFKVKLIAKPSGNVTVSLRAVLGVAGLVIDADTSTRGNQSTLSFTPRNWDTEQTVSVFAGHDDNRTDGFDVINLTPSGSGFTTGTDVRVIVEDDDEAAMPTLTNLTCVSRSVGTGNLARFTNNCSTSVKMIGRMEHTVIPNRTGHENGRVLAPGANTTFVNFFGSNDTTLGGQFCVEYADQARQYETGYGCPDNRSNAYNARSVPHSLTATRKLDAGLRLPSTFSMDEGTTAQFNVRLTTIPTSNVTVTIEQPSASRGVTVDTNRSAGGNQNTLTFTPANWGTTQPVYLTAADDDNALSTEFTLNLSASGGGSPSFASVRETVSVTVAEMDSFALDVSTTDLELTQAERSGGTGTASFTVKLKSEITANVTVAITGQDSATGLTLDRSSLTFTPANWNTAQTVRASATYTADTGDDVATLTLTTSGAPGYGPLNTARTASVKVHVAPSLPNLVFGGPARSGDDDPYYRDFNVYNVLEGTSMTYTLRLDKAPDASFERFNVFWNAPDNRDMTAVTTVGNNRNYVFTAQNWNTPQDITLTVGHDDDGVDDRSAITTFIGYRLNGVDQRKGVRGMYVWSLDDEDYRIVSSPTEWTILEGTSITGAANDSSDLAAPVTLKLSEVLDSFTGSLSVYLDPHPDNPAGVKVGAADDGIELGFSALANDPLHWDRAVPFKRRVDTSSLSTGAVYLEAAEDANDDDETYRFTLRGRDGDSKAGLYAGISNEIKLTVLDNDVIVPEPSSKDVSVTEGGTQTFTVRLRTQPEVDTTFTLTNRYSASVPLTISPARLAFTPGSWNTPQTITLTAGEDADSVDTSTVIDFKGVQGDAARAVPVNVRVMDNDPIDLRLSADNLTVDEGGSGTFTVRMKNDPNGPRSVTLTSDNSDVTLSPSRLEFTGGQGTWDDPQTVTVRIAQDDDNVDETAEITIAGDSITEATLSLTIEDDESFPVTVSDDTLTVIEDDTATFMVIYGRHPGNENVTVNLVSSNRAVTVDTDSGTAGNQTSMIFNAGNWETARTVTVAAAADADEDDGSATISVSAGGALQAQVEVTIIDKDGTPLTVSQTALTLVEGGTSGSFTIKPAENPGHDLTVSIISDNPDVTVDTDSVTTGNQTSLTFTTSNWDTAQSVSVSAANDDDRGDDSARLIINGAGAQPSSVSVTVTEDDVISLQLSVSSPLTVYEDTDTDITVRLSTAPSDTVVYKLRSNSPVLPIDESARLLTFTDRNWNVPQTVTLKAGRDDDTTDTPVTLTIECSARSDSCTGVNQATLEVTINEVVKPVIEGGQVRFSTQNFTVSEGDNTTFMVKLDQRPTANVSVRVEARAARSTTLYRGVTFEPEILSFTTTNWSLPQTVTITATQDADRDDFVGNLWAGNDTDDRVGADLANLYVLDDDFDFIFSPASTLEIEEGSRGSFTMELSPDPGGDSAARTVFVTSDNPDVTVDADRFSLGRQSSVSMPLLGFRDGRVVTQPTLVRVYTTRDKDADDETATLTIRSGTGAVRTLTVRVVDNFSRRIIVEPARINALEGDTLDSADDFPLTVRLSDQPSGDVRVRLIQAPLNPAGLQLGDGQGSGLTLDFDEDDWSTPKRFDLSGGNRIRIPEDDADRVDNDFELFVRNDNDATGVVDDYEDVISETITLSVSDNDVARPLLPASTVQVDEGGSTTFSIRLARNPGLAGQSVRLIAPANADVTIDTNLSNPGNQDTLNFTTATWNTPQTVTVFAAQDDDAVNDMTEIPVNPFALSGSVRQTSVAVEVIDDEVGFVLTPAELTVTEGASQTFSVALSRSPGSDKTVTLASSHADVTLSSTTLNFTSDNWGDRPDRDGQRGVG